MIKVSVFSILFLLTATFVLAQDPTQVAPDIYKLKFENDRVKVMEVAIAPGGKIGSHSHPDHVVYALTAGKLKITGADGKATEAETIAGSVMYMPAQTHSAENIGTTELKLVVIDLKK